MTLEKFDYHNAVVKHTPSRLQDYLKRYVHGQEQYGIDAKEYELDIRLLECWSQEKKIYHFPKDTFHALWTADLSHEISLSHFHGLSGTFYLSLPEQKFFLLGEDNELLGAFVKCSTHSGITLLDLVLDFGGDAAELWSVTYQLHPHMATLQDFVADNKVYLHEISEVLRDTDKTFNLEEYDQQAATIARILHLISHLPKAQCVSLSGNQESLSVSIQGA